MKLAPFIFIVILLGFGCAANRKSEVTSQKPEMRMMTSQAQPESVITPANPFPQIVRKGLSKTNFTIVWADADVMASNQWTFEVASNLSGPWQTADQDNVDGNAFVRLHGARFIRMKGEQ